MKASVKYFSLIMLTAFLFGCTKDFVVKNIKNSTITVISPADNISTANNNIIFWWDELDGAEKYNLQIVKPNFTSVTQLLVDTNVTGTKFSFVFTPGTYQWRIKGVNAGGSTIYNTRTFTIDTTSNLIYLTVNMTAPVTNTVVKTNTINFSWTGLNAATGYNIKVLSGSATGATVVDVNTTGTSYTYSFTPGIYFWKVNASNAFSNSPYGTPFSFKIDQTSPQAPLLSTPANATIVKDTTFFKWTYNAGSVNADIMSDSLFISTYPDSVFAAPTTVLVPRAGTTSSNSYRINSILTSPTNTLTASSYYWWKVKSIDSVGNISPASQVLKFKLH